MASNGTKTFKPVMMVHGGAWTIPDNLVEDSRKGLKDSVQAGYKVLLAGGSALDAVVAAISTMEDDPCFDAGKGSVLTADGTVEMDSMIMDGKTLKAGSVGCVHCIANPIKLARAVMEKSEHVLLVGEGANRFAEEVGIPRVAVDSLVSEHAIEEWKMFSKSEYKSAVKTMFRQGTGHDTVGAVAMDCNGNIACGTSTGGITAKHPGRVGDTPIVGCGGYADNQAGGVSTTGHGEGIMRVGLARQAIFLMDQGLSPQEAAEKSLQYMSDRVGSYGGLIVLGKDGDVGQAFTTARMSRAWAKDGVMHYGVENADIVSCPIE